jgi:Rieske Fe-S protein
MHRGDFIKFFVPGIWALQACMKDEESETNETKQSLKFEFPTPPDFFIAGVINPVRFSITPSQEATVKLYDESATQLIAEEKGTKEVWLAIPNVPSNTRLLIEINNRQVIVDVKNISGKAVSIKQNEVQFSQGKTIAILDTSDIPFAIKRTSADAYEAFDMTCTHNGCLTNLIADNSFSCPCHGSTFDTNGEVTNGPAIKPLRKFSITYFPNHQVVVVNNK